MSVKNIFIAGFEKCGTTALADWMLINNLVEDRVPGIKEAHLYLDDQLHPAKIRTGNLPLLDASVGYASNPAAIQRLPENDTRIVLCLRNQFERLWSSYKMFKLVGTESEAANTYFFESSATSGARNPVPRATAAADAVEFYKAINRRPHPRRFHHIIERYLTEELTRLHAQSFLERIEYELGFYLSRRTWPLITILGPGFFYYPLRTVLEKYQPADVSVVSVNQLKNPEQRQRFVESVFEKSVVTSEVPFSYSNAHIEIDEPEPDFNHSAYDLLRSFFKYDLEQARPLINTTQLGSSMLDNQGLDLYMVKR